MDVKAEGAAAKAWRKKRGFSRRALAQHTGFSERTIGAYEAGQFAPDKPVQPEQLKIYKRTCAAVAAGLDFDWVSVRFNIVEARVTID